MRRTMYALLFVMFLFSGIPSARALLQAGLRVKVDSPRPGEAVQGTTAITGNTAVDGFASYELAFAFSGDTTGTWFILVKSSQMVENGILGEWDTTTLTDGLYRLRLTVELVNQPAEVIFVEDLRVRNYSVIETSTPAPTATLNPEQTATPTKPPPPASPTALPANPAEISSESILDWVRGGAATGGMLLVSLAIYAWVRRRGSAR